MAENGAKIDDAKEDSEKESLTRCGSLGVVYPPRQIDWDGYMGAR